MDGKDSGVYRATPLSRLNAADGMATPLAQAEYEKMYSTLGGKPVHHTLATHWARLIELLYAAERLLELSQDKEITGPNIRNIPANKPTEGVGIVEAPRGTLTHHYMADEKGCIKKCNLIVGTTNNQAALFHVGQEGGAGADQAGQGYPRIPAEPDRDGLAALRPLHVLLDAHVARHHAARDHGGGQRRQHGQETVPLTFFKKLCN